MRFIAASTTRLPIQNLAIGWRYLLFIFLGACSACSSQAINHALYSMGEQADCARANNNRVDEDVRHVNCLAEASNSQQYLKYNADREKFLTK